MSFLFRFFFRIEGEYITCRNLAAMKSWRDFFDFRIRYDTIARIFFIFIRLDSTEDTKNEKRSYERIDY